MYRRVLSLVYNDQVVYKIFQKNQSRLIGNVIRPTPAVANNNIMNGPVGEKVAVWMKVYEDFVGLSDVKVAQNRVLAAEKKFLETQEYRRERQLQIQQIQSKLKEIQTALDKTFRGDDRYLQLVTQEHSIIKDERRLTEEFQFYEKSEREYFSALSNALRDSHERERAYAEKTKYWSIIGSVCGAIIGILGTSINNWVRLRELRDLVKESASSTSVVTTPKLEELANGLSEALLNQEKNQIAIINDFKALLAAGTPSSEKAAQETIASMKHFNATISQELSDMKTLLTTRHLVSNVNDSDEILSGAVVYMGRDVERLVKDAQNNLEWKIKINSLATVALIYAAFAVSVPVLYKFFGGGV